MRGSKSIGIEVRGSKIGIPRGSKSIGIPDVKIKHLHTPYPYYLMSNFIHIQIRDCN